MELTKQDPAAPDYGRNGTRRDKTRRNETTEPEEAEEHITVSKYGTGPEPGSGERCMEFVVLVFYLHITSTVSPWLGRLRMGGEGSCHYTINKAQKK